MTHTYHSTDLGDIAAELHAALDIARLARYPFTVVNHDLKRMAAAIWATLLLLHVSHPIGLACVIGGFVLAMLWR